MNSAYIIERWDVFYRTTEILRGFMANEKKGSKNVIYDGQIKPITEGFMKGNIKNNTNEPKPNTPPPPQKNNKK